MPLPEVVTVREVLTRALDFYDGKVANQGSRFQCGFFRKTVPFYNQPHITQLRNIQNKLYKNPSELSDLGACEQIEELIHNDLDYPENTSAHVRCETILDYFLFQGTIYKEKYNPDLSYSSATRTMLLCNLIHLGSKEAVQVCLEEKQNFDKNELNQYLIEATGNSCTESVLYMLQNFENIISLEYADKNIQNNMLMLAIAKGRGHKATNNTSLTALSELIDYLLDNFLTCQSINQQDWIGMTVLHLAVLQGDKTSIEKLITAGPDVTLENREGLKACDYLGISFQEASQHLRGYTSGGHSRVAEIKNEKRLSIVGKLGRFIYEDGTFTMPSEKTWNSAREDIRELMKEHYPEEFKSTVFCTRR